MECISANPASIVLRPRRESDAGRGEIECRELLRRTFSGRLLEAEWPRDRLSGNDGWPDGSVEVIFVSGFSEMREIAQWQRASHVRILAYSASSAEFDDPAFKKTIDSLTRNGWHPLFPDTVTEEVHHPSPEKVLDAILCKRAKRKYRSIWLGEPSAIEKQWRDGAESLIRLGKLLQGNGFNGSATDGFISMRMGAGILITASDTDKSEITLQRTSYISGYDRNTNAISWLGTHAPSSESGCSVLALQAFPDQQFVVHFHCKAITYSPLADAYRTKRYIPYGTTEEAVTVVEQLKKSPDPHFAVLRGHGEVVVGETPEAVAEIAFNMRTTLAK